MRLSWPPRPRTSRSRRPERGCSRSDELELGEIEFPAGYGSASHRHGATEIFYVISGELEHVVNGRSARLRPGQVGLVRSGEEVMHRVPGSEPCRVLVIWVPGGEAERLAGQFASRPID